MKLTEVGQLLTLITSYDRIEFRPEAVDTWFGAMRNVAFEDAEAAVHQIFRTAGHDEKGGIRRLLPADVKRPAEAIGAARRRKAAQAAITAGPAPAGRPMSAEARAALAAARAKVAEAEARYRERIAA
jgi:hypothetical protein